MDARAIFEKVLSALRVTPVIDGLEISDAAVRFAHFDGVKISSAAVTLVPDTLASGRIKNYAGFVDALRALHNEVIGPSRRRIINVALSLSSADIYTHVFSLPLLKGDGLEKAVELNLKMVSPTNVAETYSGWQVVSRDEKISKLEVLGAFVGKAIVDDLIRALDDAGFAVHAVEPRSLALVRLLREQGAGFDARVSYVLATVAETGLEFLVIRNGQFYFQYLVSWSDVQGVEKEITQAAFDDAVLRSMHQVLNFYNAHWPEGLAGIFVMPTAVKDEVVRVLSENFPIAIMDTAIQSGGAVQPEWFVAFGSSLRSRVSHAEDSDISLLGISAAKEFWRHELLDFLRFWRLTIPVTLSIVLILFIGANVLFGRAERSLMSQLNEGTRPDQMKEIAALKADAKEFNRSVGFIATVAAGASPKAAILDAVHAALAKNDITANQISIQKSDVLVSASAHTENQIRGLKKTLEEDKNFTAVDLPFAEIRATNQGLSFTVKFSVALAMAK